METKCTCGKEIHHEDDCARNICPHGRYYIDGKVMCPHCLGINKEHTKKLKRAINIIHEKFGRALKRLGGG